MCATYLMKRWKKISTYSLVLGKLGNGKDVRNGVNLDYKAAYRCFFGFYCLAVHY